MTGVAQAQASLFDFGLAIGEVTLPVQTLSPEERLAEAIVAMPEPVEPDRNAFRRWPDSLLNKRIPVPEFPSSIIRADVDANDVNYNISRLN